MHALASFNKRFISEMNSPNPPPPPIEAAAAVQKLLQLAAVSLSKSGKLDYLDRGDVQLSLSSFQCEMMLI